MKCKWCEGDLVERDKIFKDGTRHTKLFCEECQKSNGFKRIVPNEEFLMPFGRYKGWRIKNIPRDYLLWGSEELKGSLAERFNELLGRKGKTK